MAFRKAKEGVRDPENRSDKDCVCGGHSANDVKKNLNHHSTLMRHLIRKSRQHTPEEARAYSEFIDSYFEEIEIPCP